MSIRVLVVEDEPVAAAAHASYVERVDGFSVVGTAHTAAGALRALGLGPGSGRGEGTGVGVDVVLLDLHLPDGHGLDVVRALRAAGRSTDVIAVTSARDLAVVRASVSQGIVQYLLKPFAFAALRDRLERYRSFREQLAAAPSAASQDEVDRAVAALRGTRTAELPKGLGQDSLDAVVAGLRGRQDVSALEVATAVGMSRVTARRYLEHLVESGAATRSSRYGGTGRPEVGYSWVD